MFKYAKNAKRFVSISAAAVCLLSSLRIAPIGDFAVAADNTMTAFEITENMKIGWNLGNTLDATASANNQLLEHAGVETETAWGQPKASQEMFNAIKAKGFNTVRIPTTWFQHLDENDNIDPEWMARVHEVVDYAYKNDMYVILNLHHENWVNRSDLGTAYDVMKPRLLKLWSQIAEEFKDYDQHLIFECMNEPRAVGTTHEWWGPEQSEVDTINNLNADFVELIRGMDSPYAKTRLLMIPGYCASSDVSMTSLIEVPDDEFVAVSIHAYSPYNFTMNTNEAQGAFHDSFTSSFSNELAGILDGMRQYFTDKDIPVVIGEFGASNFGNTQARIDWATQYLTTTKKYGIPCVLWDNDARTNKDLSERHDYMNRTTFEWYEDSVQVVDTMMNILNDDSIAWGSERHLPTISHQAYDQGTKVYSGPTEIDASKSDTYQNTTPGGDGEITWDKLEGKEVAIKYTGATPILCFSNAAYGNWTEIKHYAEDADAGIAYYNMAKVPDAWGDDTATIAHMQAKTLGVTTIDSIVILDAPEGEIAEPAPTALIKKVNLSSAKDTDSITVTLEGPAGTKNNGALGFMKGDDWTQIEWSGTVGSDGKLVVTIPLADVPKGNAEFQVWGNFDLVEITNVVIGAPVEDTTTTTAPVVTTTTTVVTEPKDVETTTTTVQQPKDFVPGDANGDKSVDMGDVVLIMQSLANPNKYSLDETAALAADVYENNGVTNQDALAIQQYLLKLIDTLPVPEGTVVG